MTNVRDFGYTQLLDWAWPVTYRWRVRAPWGDSAQTFTVDVPGLAGDLEGSMNLGQLLWQRTLAAASTRHVELVSWDTVMWRFQPSGLPMPAMFTKGLLDGAAAPRADAAVLVMHTGHADAEARRRLYLPGIPAAWVEGGKLGRGAWDALDLLGQVLVMGCMRHLTGSPMQWLIAYPGVDETDVANPAGVAFRRVERVRVCEHTDKAPVPSGEPWP